MRGQITADKFGRAQIQQQGRHTGQVSVGQLVGQTILHFENPSARMSRLGSGELLGDRRTLDDIVTAYRAVTLDDVNTLAREVLAPVPVVALAGASVSRSLAEGLQKHWLI